ncbi:MAG: hypothetical protein V4503_11140 [Gemmatimonadota bacterium]
MRITIPGTVRLFAGALLLAGCASKPTQGGVALAMSKVAGDGQSAYAATQVPTPPAVRITDDAFEPVADVEVTFRVTGGGGSVTGATAVTDEQGIARAGGWTLGANPGVNTLTASASNVVGSPASFTASTLTLPTGGDKPQLARDRQ